MGSPRITTYKHPSWDDDIEEFLAGRKGIGPVTIEGYRGTLLSWLKFANGRHLSIEVFNDWINHLENVKKIRANSIAKVYWIAREYLEWRRPGSKAKIPDWTKVSARRERPQFTEEDFQKLLANVKGEWRLAIWIAKETGLRMGDVATLEWSEIRLDKKGIRLEPNKTKRHGKVCEIPLPNALCGYLATQRLEHPKEKYLMPEMSIQYQWDRHKSLKRQFLRHCEKLGIKGKSFHLIRNYRITTWLKNGVSPAIVSTILGLSVNQVMSYSALTMDDTRKALGL